MEDWKIAEKAEKTMLPIAEVAASIGLPEELLIPMGNNLAKVNYIEAMQTLPELKQAKYINVTAITPTPLGEGKTTSLIGLVEGLGKLNKKVAGAIRQPSGGPTFNIKGSAAGGGYAQCIPLAPFSIRMTGDIDSINNAHNLAMVALTARMQHEHNYDDEVLARRGLKRVDIDPDRIQMKWAIDFCAQALRNITIGKGGNMDGLEMDSGFQITVSSEIMAILAIAKDLKDMRQRMGKIIVAYDKKGQAVTTDDLEVAGAMTAWMVDAINPTLIQTLEGQPIFVHAGPFANIAIGQNSIIADKLACRLADYVVTESGFGADIGFEKFWNLKCRQSGLKPDAVVLVATVRALKMHGGGPTVKAGNKLDATYTQENLDLLAKGCENLIAHLEIVKKSGVRPVVCINNFDTDSPAEIAMIKALAEEHGAYCALSKHWAEGGAGSVELAEAVIAACEETHDFKFLYDLDLSQKERIECIAKEIYGADGVSYSDKAETKLAEIAANPALAKLGTCMVKTHLSLSHDPTLKGRPKGWILPISDILTYQGAGYIVPVAGDIKLLPGTGSKPAFARIDVDVVTGKIEGLF